MNPEKDKAVTQSQKPSEEHEPKAGTKVVPIWLVILFAMAFYWGQLYLDLHSGGFNARVHEPYRNFNALAQTVPSDDPLLALGRQVYTANCALCHQVSGRGTPGVYPPLSGADWVLADGPERLIRIVLQGIYGPITVNGENYNGAMPPLGTMLNDEQVAAVLTYIRHEWGNDASRVSVEEVAAVRAAESRRAMPWTADELMQIPVGQGPQAAAPAAAPLPVEAPVAAQPPGGTEPRAAVTDVEGLMALGQQVYMGPGICFSCHQATGQGLPPMFPPLAGADWVLAEGPDRLARIVLHGVQGPMMVNGTEFGLMPMPAQGAMLNDEQIAGVLTFIRRSWGNNASPVMPETITRIRQAESGRAQPWTQEELLRIPVGE